MQPKPEPLPSLLARLDEAALYHRAGDRGFFTLLWADSAAAPGNRQPVLKIQRAYRLDALPQVIEAIDPERDTWISQAEFGQPNRRIVHLLRLGLCFVDLDTYKTPWRDTPPESLLRRFLGYCGDEGLPHPSLVVYSGRGLQAKWLLERPLPRAALPRWNAVQKELVARLEPFGADPGARDASRVLRLVDTVNTRSGERVRVLWVQWHAGEVRQYGFELLAETLLPVAREILQLKRQPPAERRTALKVLPGGKTGNSAGLLGPATGVGPPGRPPHPRQAARLDGARRPARLPLQVRPLVPELPAAVRSGHLQPDCSRKPKPWCGKSVPDFTKEVRSILSTLYRKAQAYECRRARSSSTGKHLSAALHPPQPHPAGPVRRAGGGNAGAEDHHYAGGGGRTPPKA